MGKHFRIGDGTLVEVVGIVEDGKYLSLTEDQEPAILMPSMLYDDPQSYLVVRSERDPEQLQKLMRAKLRELDEGLPVDIQSWNQLLEVVQFPAKVATMALGMLGAMGAILSITGIFGMAAYSVSRRMRELGIRVALGAKKSQVLSTAFGRAIKLLACGSAGGPGAGAISDTRADVDCVSGNAARSPRACGGGGGHGPAGRARDMDSRAAGAPGRSHAAAARRMNTPRTKT